MNKILVVGDLHGQIVPALNAVKKAKAEGCSAVFQVGDFGWWPFHNDGYVHKIEKCCERYDIDFYWIDGNHEHFDDLESRHFEQESFYRLYEIPNSATHKMLKRVRYVPRGSRWEWEGKKFFAFGGAASIDKEYRTPHVDWFPNELPSWKQIEDVLDNPETCDIMFSHDAPWYDAHDARMAIIKSLKVDAVSQYCRNAIRALVDHVEPKTLFHGHYHTSYTMEHVREDGKVTTLRGMAIDEGLVVEW